MKKNNEYLELNPDQGIRFWRKKISDSIFYFLSIFGFIAYIPSLLLSLRDDLILIAAIDTAVYGAVIFITFFKPLTYMVRAITGSVLFYILGLLLLIVLGPVGAGNLWLFAFSLIAGMTLGEKASIISLIINTVTQISIYIILKTGILYYETFFIIQADVWLIRAVNFIILNFIIVISNIIFVRGFQKLLSRADETKKATIIGLASLAEHRDSNTGEHLERIQFYTTILARGLSKRENYRDYITENYINDIGLSSILHDIGKVGIQDSILLKPAGLTEEEFETIKLHATIGGNVIRQIEKNIEGPSLYLLAREIAYYHHEKWDGMGYPEGLKEKQIPLSARIVALADVYDALTSDRPYKRAFSHEEAAAIITAERGRHFDPLIVDIFLEKKEEFSAAIPIAAIAGKDYS